MRRTLLLLSILYIPAAIAQVIPGDQPGDTGWMFVGQFQVALVRAGDGHVWLQQNLGSTAVATAPDDADAFGNLYQWGRWTDGHQLRNSSTAAMTSLPSNDPSGLGIGSSLFLLGIHPADWWGGGSSSDSWNSNAASATSGVDPCSSLGENWHVATQQEWMELLDQEGITDVTTAFTSNLKLTASGSREGTQGVIINEGTYGNYWSATTSSQYAKDLTIGADFVNPDDDAYRSYGMSLRCLNRSLHMGVEAHSGLEGFSMIQDPLNSKLSLSSLLILQNVEIIDISGRVVRSLQVNSTTTNIDLLSLPQGTFVLRATTSEGIFARTFMHGNW